MELNLAELIVSNEDRFPARAAVVQGNRHLSFTELAQRTRRLGRYLGERGLGCHTERDPLPGHRSGQDLMGQLLHNGPAYIEGLIGAFQGRVAPFNINYRYKGDELCYLLQDARPRAIQYHASFAPVLAEVLPRVPPVDVLLQVADASRNPLLPGAVDYETALASTPDEVLVQPSPDDLYILYTGGTTGMPKGVLWRQADIAVAALAQLDRRTGTEWSSREDRLSVFRESPLRVLCSAPFMHGAAQWGVLQNLCDANTIVIPTVVDQFDAEVILDTVEAEGVTHLTIVGDAFARPLLEALDATPRALVTLRSLVSGGAALRPEFIHQFTSRFPNLRVVETMGASEAGVQGHRGSAETTPGAHLVFAADPSSVVISEAKDKRLAPGHAGIGWLGRRGRIPLGYLEDESLTARSFPVVDGERLSVPGDRARLLPDGSIEVLGRDSVTINSGGEKVFAEEVEAAVRSDARVADVVVCPGTSERWGQEVVAIVSVLPGSDLTAEGVRSACRSHLAGYKLPKRVIFVSEVQRGPNGKADYHWARELADR